MVRIFVMKTREPSQYKKDIAIDLRTYFVRSIRTLRETIGPRRMLER